MIRFLTAGESHGKTLTVIVEGFPSNLKISEEFINNELRRRQWGYGRGGRMNIEKDEVEILSGLRYGKTIGSPVSMLIRNIDWQNWQEIMDSRPVKKKSEKISIPRPGHADLTGTMKYDFDDIRNSIERSSARETAARVAAGSLAKIFLRELNIHIGSFVESIGGVYAKKNLFNELLEEKDVLFDAEELNKRSDLSDVRVLDGLQEQKIKTKIRSAKKNGDTLGGTFCVAATGVPSGLGSFMHFDRKISAAFSSAVMSINGVKGVEIGSGFTSADKPGSLVHDEIVFDGEQFLRRTNRAGGIEGGITTGMPVIIRGAMKPISTLMKPLKSIDLAGINIVDSRRERSDFVAVPACAVIAESMVAWVIAEFFLIKFGGDSISEIRKNYSGYTARILRQIKKNF